MRLADTFKLLPPSRLVQMLRPAPDSSTSEGRAHERHRQIAFGAASAGVARAVSVLTALISIPLTLHYLGDERFGMWATLSSFQAFLSFTDFGIGNGVLTAVAHRVGRGDEDGLRRYVSTAYLALSGVALALVLLALASPLAVDWSAVFAVTSPLARAEAVPAAVLFIVLYALGNPIGLIMRIQAGLQRQWQASLWLLAGNLASLVALVVAIQLEASLVWLVLALVGTPLLFLLVNTLVFLGAQRRDLAPSPGKFDRAAFGDLTRTGTMFMILQLCAAVIFQSSNLIIAQVLGAPAVAAFAVPDRMFSVVTIILTFAFTPLWAAYGEAAARGDVEWVRRTFRRSLLVAVIGGTLLSLVLLIASPWLLRWWIGHDYAAPFALLAALAAWKVLEAVNNAIAMLLNALNEVPIQVIGGVACAVATVGLRLWLVESEGVVGAVYGGMLASVLASLPITLIAVRRVMRRLEPIRATDEAAG